MPLAGVKVEIDERSLLPRLIEGRQYAVLKRLCVAGQLKSTSVAAVVAKDMDARWSEIETSTETVNNLADLLEELLPLLQDLSAEALAQLGTLATVACVRDSVWKVFDKCFGSKSDDWLPLLDLSRSDALADASYKSHGCQRRIGTDSDDPQPQLEQEEKKKKVQEHLDEGAPEGSVRTPCVECDATRFRLESLLRRQVAQRSPLQKIVYFSCDMFNGDSIRKRSPNFAAIGKRRDVLSQALEDVASRVQILRVRPHGNDWRRVLELLPRMNQLQTLDMSFDTTVDDNTIELSEALLAPDIIDPQLTTEQKTGPVMGFIAEAKQQRYCPKLEVLLLVCQSRLSLYSV